MTDFAEESATPGRPRPAVAVVALGANLGDREKTLEAALSDLAQLPLTDRVRASAVMETVAVTTKGPDESAPRFLNSVALVATRLAPSVLLGYLHQIEAQHGRDRGERWAARTLDLDLISYGDVISDDARLILPHPRAAEREFVLAPWREVDPAADLPGVGPVDAVLEALRGAR
ncbi:2-amino-4-hydroxy-6-hydroxymethyldihydropteridine diphosphokinase [Microbacterium sp. P06]|uniref:2-amino-4-hydroxy-6- hydroxymethyldihydropteridine diphosphokinase n=1 Tax=unclassified Microbacterium TaxID=2609290 RepID=UPI00374745F8